MGKLESYTRKHGRVEGPKMFRPLQREAAHASNHAQHLKRLRRAVAP